MLGRILLITAAAVLVWIFWVKLRRLFLGLSQEKRKKVDAGANQVKGVKLEKDPETGRYRPKESDTGIDRDDS